MTALIAKAREAVDDWNRRQGPLDFDVADWCKIAEALLAADAVIKQVESLAQKASLGTAIRKYRQLIGEKT